MTFSEEIKQRRLELGMTQQQMADYIGISKATYRNLENYSGGYGGSFPCFKTIWLLKKKGVLDYSYAEAIQTIKRDRQIRVRYSKGNRYYKKD